MLKAVFFDMGGTIETYWHTPELRLQATPGLSAILHSAGIDLQINNKELYEVVIRGITRYHHWSMQSLEELPASQIWCGYILNEFSVDPLALGSIAEELTTYYETQYYHREMRPEIPVVLEKIRSMGLKIGLISNVRSRGQVPVNLNAYGIRHYFDPVVLSSEYGRRKPDPAIFHYAARLANVPTSDCVFVGDRINRDVAGARRAGFRLAVQIEHPFPPGEADDGPRPDFLIRSMDELVDILRDELQSPSRPAPHPIRALIFDAGDILYHRPHRGRKLKAYLKELGIKRHRGYEQEKEKIEHLAYQGQMTQYQYREALIRLYGIDQPEQVERGVAILEEEDDDIQFFEGIQATLTTLKQRGYWLGIVTDTSSPVSVKLRWFEQGGFGHLWDSIVSSLELGVRKPDPKIYTAALQQLGLRPDETVFVGHKASELDGARGVGMQTIAFNYEPRAKADIYIQDFCELSNLPLLS
jgi:putative hydrolase of the HAD superfamily